MIILISLHSMAGGSNPVVHSGKIPGAAPCVQTAGGHSDRSGAV
jgi:hypothetical protein